MHNINKKIRAKLDSKISKKIEKYFCIKKYIKSLQNI
jgi:hypothetical protein